MDKKDITIITSGIAFVIYLMIVSYLLDYHNIHYDGIDTLFFMAGLSINIAFITMSIFKNNDEGSARTNLKDGKGREE